MTDKEKAVQKALGTLPTFTVTFTIKVRTQIAGANIADALTKSGAMLKVLCEKFPECEFNKHTQQNRD